MATSTKSVKIDYYWLRAITPLSWPLWLRRGFMVGFPIALPIYVIVLVALMLCVFAVRLSEPVAEFWHAPQKKVRSNYYYSYEYEARQKRKAAERDAQDDENA
ncbi:MAG: hypothetical protein ACKOPO_08090 [Novosphingobium sp.]